MGDMDHAAFKARVEQLAAERGMSVSALRFAAYDPAIPGTNPNTTASALVGRRPITLPMIEAFARVLQVDPAVEFPEYRLLKVHELLDPDIHGVDGALANLDRLERATRTAARAPGRREAAPRAASRPPKRADRPARRKAGGA